MPEDTYLTHSMNLQKQHWNYLKLYWKILGQMPGEWRRAKILPSFEKTKNKEITIEIIQPNFCV